MRRIMKEHNLKASKKDKIESIVRSISNFYKVVPFATSHFNKNFKTEEPIDENVIEFYDENSNDKCDLWGKYFKKENCLKVKVYDNYEFKSFGVYLYKDHYDIPEYHMYDIEYKDLDYKKSKKQNIIKYDMKKLKDDPDKITKVIKNIWHFSDIVPFEEKDKENSEIVDLCNAKNKVYAKYDKKDNSIHVLAWDNSCYWTVGVTLYEDHYAIPKYNKYNVKYEPITNDKVIENTELSR